MFTKNRMYFAMIFLAVLSVVSSVLITAPAAEAGNQGIFEIRTYTAHPGKLGDLNNRFKNHTNSLFVKHGIRLIGYWTPLQTCRATPCAANAKYETPKSQNTLIYILAYPSREAREKSFEAFQADPAWKLVYANSIKNGPLVAAIESTLLNATEYSPLQ